MSDLPNKQNGYIELSIAKVLNKLNDEINKEKKDFVSFLKLSQGIDVKPSIYLRRHNESEDSVYYKILSFKIQFDNENEFSRYLEAAFTSKKALYFYDIEEMGELFSKVLLGKYCMHNKKCKACNEDLINIGSLQSFVINKKSVLMLYMKIFPRDNFEKVKDYMQRSIENSKKNLEGKEYLAYTNEQYNNLFLWIMEKVTLYARFNGIEIRPKIRLAYYDVFGVEMINVGDINAGKGLVNIKRKNLFSEIAKINAIAIGYKALEFFK